MQQAPLKMFRQRLRLNPMMGLPLAVGARAHGFLRRSTRPSSPQLVLTRDQSRLRPSRLRACAVPFVFGLLGDDDHVAVADFARPTAFLLQGMIFLLAHRPTCGAVS